MERVLVTGATGFVGRHLVRALVRRGHKVTALVRPRFLSNDQRKHDALQGFEDFQKGALSITEGDLFDAESLKRACTGHDTVVHLVGIIKER